VEKRSKKVNLIARLFYFVKELIVPTRKPRDLGIDWIQMKLDTEDHPIPGQEQKYK